MKKGKGIPMAHSSKGWQLVNTFGKATGKYFKTAQVARQYATKRKSASPINMLEFKLDKALKKEGYDNAIYSQRGDYGDEFVLLRLEGWERIDAKTLTALKDIEPSVTEFDIFDDKGGWKYGYDIKKNKF